MASDVPWLDYKENFVHEFPIDILLCVIRQLHFYIPDSSLQLNKTAFLSPGQAYW
jgi:hypothetical protein